MNHIEHFEFESTNYLQMCSITNQMYANQHQHQHQHQHIHTPTFLWSVSAVNKQTDWNLVQYIQILFACDCDWKLVILKLHSHCICIGKVYFNWNITLTESLYNCKSMCKPFRIVIYAQNVYQYLLVQYNIQFVCVCVYLANGIHRSLVPNNK